MTPPQSSYRVAVLLLPLLLCAAIVVCGQAPASTGGATGTGDVASMRPEQMLATIDAGTTLAASDPAQTPYSFLLDSLERKCTEPRIRLADYAVFARDRLKAAGKPMTVRQTLTLIDATIPSSASGLRCAEVVAAMLTAAHAN